MGPGVGTALNLMSDMGAGNLVSINIPKPTAHASLKLDRESKEVQHEKAPAISNLLASNMTRANLPSAPQFDRFLDEPDDPKLKYDRYMHEHVRSPLNFEK